MQEAVQGMAQNLKFLLLYPCLVFAFTTICSPQDSSSGYMDGNMLLEKCEAASPSSDKTECLGYVAGVMDSSATMLDSLRAASPRKVPPMYCLPTGGIQLGQAVRVTLKWLKDRPEKHHLRGDLLVMMAISDAFPCK